MRSVIVGGVAWALAQGVPGGAPPAPAAPTSPPAGFAPVAVGPAWDTDGALPEHADGIADYTLRATLDAALHTVHGEGTIAWRNASAVPVSELWLHLYLNAFKNERSAFLRERVGGRGSAPPGDPGFIDVRKLVLHAGTDAPVDLWPTAERTRPGDEDETDVRVPLPRPIGPGEHVTLDVVFDDKLPAIVERTGYRGSFHMVGQWFPKLARLEPDGRWAHFPFHHLAEFYADYGTYDVTLDVPAGFTVGATGPVREQRTEGGRAIERHVQADVHDFAWTAWDRFERTEESIDGVAVRVLAPPGFAAVAARDLASVRFALPYFSARYGRYPYTVLTVVHPQMDAGEAGGMEYPTLITSVAPWFVPAGFRLPELVTVHELGHQWFYGLVGTDERAWPFLDEGLNQAAEVDALDAWLGRGAVVDLLGLRVDDAAWQADEGNRRALDEPVAQAADAFTTGGNYSSLVYSRTATLIETLRRVYGDAAVTRALGRYARRYRFQHPGPEELLSVFAEVLGSGPADTMRAALFSKGWVGYAAEYATSRAAPGGGFDDAALVRRRGTIGFPVDVALRFADGTTRLERWDGEGDSRRFASHDAAALRSVVVDPDLRVLLDARVDDNHRSTADGGGGAWLSLERVTYWLELALQAVSP